MWLTGQPPVTLCVTAPYEGAQEETDRSCLHGDPSASLPLGTSPCTGEALGAMQLQITFVGRPDSGRRVLASEFFYRTTNRSLVKWFRTSTPVSVTMTRSSTRTPHLPGR